MRTIKDLIPDDGKFYVMDLTAPEKSAKGEVGFNDHDFMNPQTAGIESFRFMYQQSREVPLFVAQRCEAINAGSAQPAFFISQGDAGAKPFDSSDLSLLTLPQLVSRLMLKQQPETQALLDLFSAQLEKVAAHATAETEAALKVANDRIAALEADLAQANKPSAAPSAGAGLNLKSDEVIASLSELSAPALLDRCKSYEDCPFHGGSKKDEMIAFLMAKAAAPASPAADDVT